jgi:hypothetical protein
MSGTTVSPLYAATVTSVARKVSSLGRWLAFWLAIVLPFVYLPLALVDPGRLVDVRLLGGFVSLNLLALVVGHEYGADDPGDAPR